LNLEGRVSAAPDQDELAGGMEVVRKAITRNQVGITAEDRRRPRQEKIVVHDDTDSSILSDFDILAT
jgi:hypothetical protein